MGRLGLSKEDELPEIIVVRRPRTYADRRWLESYSTSARTLSYMVPTMRPHNIDGQWFTHYAVQLSITLLRQAFASPKVKVTHGLRGAIDAWLDSVNC